MLSIVIPFYNEKLFINKFIERLEKSFKNYEVEYIFVNDGSTDGSNDIVYNYINKKTSNNFQYIDIKRNMGKGYALRQGIKIAKGEYIIFQDADLELNTDDSLEMYKIIFNDKEIKVLFGTRYGGTGKLKKNYNLINEFVSKINTLIFNLLFWQSISDLHCGTKIVHREVLDKIDLKINDFGFEIDIASQIAKNKYQIYEYGISYIARTKKEGKKITWVDGIKSYFYIFKSRFIDNSYSTILSIFFSSLYMAFIGSYFGLGTGKTLVVFFFLIIGCIIGLNFKFTTSSIIFLFCYLGSLFSSGNGKIYTVLSFFIIGLFIAKKISLYLNKITKNRFVKFFV